MGACNIFRTEDFYKIITESETEDGFLLSGNPIFLVQLKDLIGLQNAIFESLRSSKKNIPTPKREQYLILEKKIMKEIQEKSNTTLYKKSNRASLRLEDGILKIWPLKFFKPDENLNGNGINGTLDDIAGTHEYEYDEIGNLTLDTVAGNPDNIESIEWNAYGKISKVTHKSGSALPNLEYIYDAAGNRVIKKKIYSNPDRTERDNYVIDVQGNIMTIYSNIYNPTATESIFIVEEQPIYDSSRLGTLTTGEHLILGGTGHDESLPTSTYVLTLGQKNYELTDHLGNVRAVIKDYVDTDTEKARVKSLVDYYAFGMEMPRRKYNQGSYKFGFGGKEKDDEWHGSTGTVYDYGFRIYDARLARFLSVDPLTESFPYYTPYQFAGNCPIKFIDLDGLEAVDPSFEKFYKDAPKINMNNAPAGSSTNAAGY